jgi:hypothetical protein
MCALFLPECLERYYLYSRFESLFFVGWYLMNLNILQKQGPSDGPQFTNSNFLENGSGDFDSISVIYVDRVPKCNSMSGILRKIIVYASGSPKDVSFLETSLAGLMDFILVQYSATNYGLILSHSQNVCAVLCTDFFFDETVNPFVLSNVKH